MFEKKQNKLKKELKRFDVFTLAKGATINGGLFLLPEIVAVYMFSPMFLAYLLSPFPLIPGMMSKVELAIAMPRSGGVYYFLDMPLGTVLGTVGRIGIWLTLSLKSFFSFEGLNAYPSVFFNDILIIPVSIGIAEWLCIINFTVAKKQTILLVSCTRNQLTICCLVHD